MKSAGSTRAAWLALLLLLGGWELFRSPNSNVERGNRAFRDGKYDEALDAYGKAAGELPNDPGVKFNRGVALYQKALNTPAGPARDQLLTQAQGEFEQSTQSPDRKLRGAARYNLGNTHFQRQEWDKAVKEYKQAIKDDPSNQDARYNLELALRKREQKKQQQQGQQGQQKDQQQQGQGQQDQQQQGQGQQQQQQDQDQQQQGQGQQDQQPQDQQGQQDQPPPQGQQGQQGQPPQDQPPPEDPSPQDQQDPKDEQGQPPKDPQPPRDPQGQDPQQPQGQPPGQPKDGQPDRQPPPGQQGADPKDGKDPKNDEQGQPRSKPDGPQRKTYGDAERKMDALERRSKDLKVQQQRGRGERKRGKVKDW